MAIEATEEPCLSKLEVGVPRGVRSDILRTVTTEYMLVLDLFILD